MHEPFKHLWEIYKKREEFYQQLDKLLDMASERKNKVFFLRGDFNAKSVSGYHLRKFGRVQQDL